MGSDDAYVLSAAFYPQAAVVDSLSTYLQCQIGTVALLISAWVRYAGTVRSLSKHSAYALIIFGQVISNHFRSQSREEISN